MQEYDIYFINKLGDNIFEILESPNKNLKKCNKIANMHQIVYIYNNMQLIVNNDKQKRCIQINKLDNKLISFNNKNLIIDNYETLNMELECFPFISKYDDILNRNTDIYKCNEITFEYITETNSKNVVISYLKIKKDNLKVNIDSIEKLIKLLVSQS